MLTVDGESYRLCDGLTRRDVLKIGALGFGGLTLPQLLRAEERAGIRESPKAIIMVYMAGAPPHQDMYDLKMDAPSGIRGDFRPIPTNVPGIEICELLPRLARIMDRLVPLRSVYGSPSGAHDSYICYTGRPKPSEPRGGWPSVGSTISELLGPSQPAVPPFVGLAPDAGHPPYGSPGLPGFLGPGHAAFRPAGEVGQDMVLRGVDTSRLGDRRALLRYFDRFRRDVDASGMMEGMDTIQQRAMDILTSSRLAEAFDLSREDPRTIDRYGKGDPKRHGDGAPLNLQHFLLARRLVEAGCRVVTLNFGRWDFHSRNFRSLRDKYLPLWDRGVSALVEDLHQRGLDQDVSFVAWGEFGRTPKINKDAGRDHWPRVGGGLLAGGGMKTGQVIGATDRIGGEPTDRPVHFGEVVATLYHNLGIDPNATTVDDLAGRPRYLVDDWRPMKELV
ncbi:MAG: DUF1501 domain-containing protein [Planctomycetota bacterium]|nr:DUF1501 domain-containing protein [Planctomycetota bacterium]